MAVITISRQAGSGGDEVARRVAELLDYRCFDKAVMAQVARERGIAENEVVDFSEDRYRLHGFVDELLRRSPVVATTAVTATTSTGQEVRLLRPVDEEMAAALVTATIRAIGKRGQVVVVGRGGQAILRDSPGVLHVRIVARLEDRVGQLMESEGLTREAAVGHIGERDRATAAYLRRFHGVDWSDPSLYHLQLNTSLLDGEEAAKVIAAAARELDARAVLRTQPQPPRG